MIDVAAGSRVIDRVSGPAGELFFLLMQQAPMGVAIIDCDGCIVRANDVFQSMISPDGNLLLALSGALCGSAPIEAFTTTLPAASSGGCERTVEVSARPLREAGGIASGKILYVCDITEKLRLEAQLAHSQRLHVVGQLTGGIAHDFGNLVMAMAGAAEAAQSRGGLSAEAHAELQEIRDGGERGADLVRQLLAFSTRREVRDGIIVVNDSIRGLSSLLSRLLGPDIELKMMLYDGHLAVRGDPTPLDQVLMNLIVNARNAMPAGGLVTVRTGELVLQASVNSDGREIGAGRYVTIDVQDVGVGIPSGVLPKIFDPFVTTRSEQGGTGLGLAMVDAIVRRFGGVITVRSQVGSGTLFRIHLPRHEDVQLPVTDASSAMNAALKPASSVVPCPAASRAVLLVDDEEGLRLLLARALSGAGWHVLCAESGETALALLQADPTGLANLCAIVTDVDLPDVQGPTLVQAVRHLRPKVPALLSSGHLEGHVRDALNEDTFFLSKPSSLRAVVNMVEKHAWQLTYQRGGDNESMP